MDKEQLKQLTPEALTALKEFADKVYDLRDGQRSYFATRDRNILDQCKKMEREVDADIREIRIVASEAKRAGQMGYPKPTHSLYHEQAEQQHRIQRDLK